MRPNPEPQRDSNDTPLKVALCFALGLITMVVFWPAKYNGFIQYDDPGYVLDNPMVKGGLSTEGLKQAFTVQQSNWHPVTWISHMLDCQLFGLNAGAHHMVSVGWHAATTILLFLLLLQMTRALWPSAIVAAFFGWHPLHVESVAWISERKDILSGFFFVLTLFAYVLYAQKRSTTTESTSSQKSWSLYFVALGAFLLGLGSKPSLVTLPFVLLLVDFWPLNRFEARKWKGLLLEKAPFFALAAISCIATVWAQQGAIESLDLLPVKTRVVNAVMSYVLYAGKIFYPTELAVFYSFKTWTTQQVAGAAALLFAVSVFAFWKRRKCPWLFVGWFWYIGMLVPMIGILQVGTQAMADRYTYLPAIGIFIAVTWLGFELLANRPAMQMGFGALLAAAVALLAPLSTAQVRLWRTTETLFQHSLKVTGGGIPIYNILGYEAEKRGADDEAMNCYNKSIQIAPNAEAHHNLGNLFAKKNKNDEAIRQYQLALNLKPNLPVAHNSLANALVAQNRYSEAIEHYKQALKTAPDFALAHYNYAMALEDQQQLVDACNEYAEAGRLGYTGMNFWFNYGCLANKIRKFALGAENLAKCVEAKPDWEEAHFQYAVALDNLGKHVEAVEQYSAVLQFWRDHAETLNNLALIYATTPNPELKSAKMAVLLATRACAQTMYENARQLDTLSRAYAYDGDFTNAIKWAERALQRTINNEPNPILKAELESRLAAYQSGKTE